MLFRSTLYIQNETAGIVLNSPNLYFSSDSFVANGVMFLDSNAKLLCDSDFTFNGTSLLIGVGTGTGLTTRALGATVGAETLPAHTHSIDHDHASFNTVDGAGSHVHTYSERVDNTGDSASTTPQWDSSGAAADGGSFYAGNAAGAHNHAVDVPAFTGTSGSTGTGSHGVMQPSLVLNYIIKY